MQSFRRRRAGSGSAAGAAGLSSPSPSRKRGLGGLGGHLTGSSSSSSAAIPRTVRVSPGASQDSTTATNRSLLLAEAEGDSSLRGSSSVSARNHYIHHRGANAGAGGSSHSAADALERYRSFNTGEEEALVAIAAANARNPAASGGGGPRGAMGKDAVARDERRASKFLIRAVSGLVLVGGFSLVLFSGHVYICALVALVEIFLFRELVKVRYNTFFHIIEDTIPMFRTTQWLWFCVAIFYTYSDFVFDVIKSNTALHYLLIYDRLQTPLAFALYSGTFIITIATMQTGHIKFQLNQLCWTILVIALTVGQLK